MVEARYECGSWERGNDLLEMWRSSLDRYGGGRSISPDWNGISSMSTVVGVSSDIYMLPP